MSTASLGRPRRSSTWTPSSTLCAIAPLNSLMQSETDRHFERRLDRDVDRRRSVRLRRHQQHASALVVLAVGHVGRGKDRAAEVGQDDPDDDRVLECAVAGRADCVVSGDGEAATLLGELLIAVTNRFSGDVSILLNDSSKTPEVAATSGV